MMAMKCCTKLETAKEICPNVFQGQPSNLKVTRYTTSPILTQIGRFRTIGRSHLSNPSDLPCLYLHNVCVSCIIRSLLPQLVYGKTTARKIFRLKNWSRRDDIICWWGNISIVYIQFFTEGKSDQVAGIFVYIVVSFKYWNTRSKILEFRAWYQFHYIMISWMMLHWRFASKRLCLDSIDWNISRSVSWIHIASPLLSHRWESQACSFWQGRKPWYNFCNLGRSPSEWLKQILIEQVFNHLFQGVS